MQTISLKQLKTDLCMGLIYTLKMTIAEIIISYPYDGQTQPVEIEETQPFELNLQSMVCLLHVSVACIPVYG